MATDVEMPLVAPTPPPPSIPRPENKTLFGFRAPVPEKKPPLLPLEEVSLKPIALQFLKLRKNVHNLLQTCSEESANGEIIENIKELKTTLKGFKTEFKKLPKINDVRDEQQQRIAELLKQIQMKDEYLVKLIGPALIKVEPEDAPIAVVENLQKPEEKAKDKAKKKKKKDKSKAKDYKLEKKLKTNSKEKSKDKAKKKVKDEKKEKKKVAEKPETSEKQKPLTKPKKDSKETIQKKLKPKMTENVAIPKSKKKLPIERRLMDPAKIKKLKEKIAEDKRKQENLKNAVAKINPEILSKLKRAGIISKPPLTPKLDIKEKQKTDKAQQKPSTKSTKSSKPSQPEILQTSQLVQKDQPPKDSSQKEKPTKDKSAQNQPSKDAVQKDGEKKDPKSAEAKPAEEVKPDNPPEPPSPPIVKIMPLPGKKLRKPEPPIKTVVTFGRPKPKEKKEPPKNPQEPLKSALKKPEGTEEESKQPIVEEKENKNEETQEKKKEEEKVETTVEDKPTTWKHLRQMYKKHKTGKKDKRDEAKKNADATKAPKSSKARKPNEKLSKQHKLRKALKRLAKIQARHDKRKQEEKKKAEEKKKSEPTERMNIFKYFEDEKAKKKASNMIPLNATKRSRIVKKVVRKPISRNEQILRKIRRNAINNARSDGHYTSPLLTVKYITELQNMIKNSEENGTPLSSADFRKLRFKYFPCKDSEFCSEKLLPAVDRRPISKTDIEQLRNSNLVKVQNDINQQNSNITHQRNNPKTITDISMRLPRKDFDEDELDQTLYQELTNMGF